MQKPEFHLFVCSSFRMNGDPQGICYKKEAVNLLQFLETEILDRGLDAQITSTGCLKACEKGPVMVIYPQGWWYGGLNEDVLDEILDALENGESCEEYLISDS